MCTLCVAPKLCVHCCEFPKKTAFFRKFFIANFKMLIIRLLTKKNYKSLKKLENRNFKLFNLIRKT